MLGKAVFCLWCSGYSVSWPAQNLLLGNQNIKPHVMLLGGNGRHELAGKSKADTKGLGRFVREKTIVVAAAITETVAVSVKEKSW